MIYYFSGYLLGCEYSWSTQPKVNSTKGAGNLLVTAATELCGISFNKISKFAKLLNLKFISKSMYYEHRGDFVFPEIDHAWRKEQQAQIAEIKESDREIELAVDGQCDSPGHNATYSTVSAMDVVTNKILNFKVVHVKVSELYIQLIYIVYSMQTLIYIKITANLFAQILCCLRNLCLFEELHVFHDQKKLSIF